jgi:hypothetical protein
MKPNDLLKLTALESQRSIEMSAGVFGKLLHMASVQGWVPDGIRGCWPRKKWDTELVLRDLSQSLGDTISDYDADGLQRALSRLVAVDGLSFDRDLYLAASGFLDVVGKRAFKVALLPSADSGFAYTI